jgi:ribonuclease P protein component
MTSSAPFKGRETFSKQERLCSRKVFGQLVESGQKINAFPFRLIFSEVSLPEEVGIQAAFTVPKRNFKKAVHRNRIKRLMREVYRKNKDVHYPLVEQSGRQFALLFIYSGNQLPDYSVTEEKLKLLLHRFVETHTNAAQ